MKIYVHVNDNNVCAGAKDLSCAPELARRAKRSITRLGSEVAFGVNDVAVPRPAGDPAVVEHL